MDAVLTMVAEERGLPWASSDGHPLGIRLGNAAVSYARYIGHVLWPSHLALLYLYPGNSLKLGTVFAALLFLLAVTAMVVVLRRQRYLLVGWLWFLGTMVPTIGVVTAWEEATADRYAYVPVVGLFIMICWGVTKWAALRHLPRRLLPAVSIAVLLALTIMTHRQIGYWKDSVTLWTHSAQVSGRNWIFDFYMGSAMAERGQYDNDTMAHFYRAAEGVTRRDFAASINLNIAMGEQQRGNLALAIEYFKKVLAISPDDKLRAQVLARMGSLYRDLGDSANAKECFEAAARPIAPEAVDWRGDWWRDLLPIIRERFRYWRTGHSASPSR